MKLGVKYIKKIYIRAHSAEAAPPLGTVLGNIGVNTTNFCTLFNNKTINLPDYFLLKTIIYVNDNRTTDFEVDMPSTSYIINLLKFERIIKVRVLDRWHEKTINCVKLYDLLQLVKLKFPYLSLKNGFGIIKGTVKSMELIIVQN